MYATDIINYDNATAHTFRVLLITALIVVLVILICKMIGVCKNDKHIYFTHNIHFIMKSFSSFCFLIIIVVVAVLSWEYITGGIKGANQYGYTILYPFWVCGVISIVGFIGSVSYVKLY